jgi:tetratricopeptide (TPR) repeat protein
LSEFSESIILDRVRTAPGPAARAELCEQALQQVRREDNPTLWGNLQGALAASVAEAHGRRYTEAIFQKVLQGYQSALSVFSPDESPEQLAATLRNIGCTHTDAAESGLGDMEAHVEAAIAVFEQAATISQAAAPDIWIGTLCDLASALLTAADWRGAAALLDSVGVYSKIIHALPRDASPEFRAWLNAQYAAAIAAAGDASRATEAVMACEQALKIYTREKDPAQWAQIQLMLGGLLRARPDGDRADNLERAATAVDAALSVFNQTDFPNEWMRAHYERGPVLVFRSGGDRNENLRQALESLHIAVAAIPCDDAPGQWASLQVTIAHALLDRTDGDPQAHIEDAIPALKAALDVLPENEPSGLRLLGMRFLGEAYLQREAGDEAENTERGIAALEAAQALDGTPVDLDAWTVAQANLGQAYLLRHQGDQAQNRTKAVAALEAALSAPFEDGRPAQGWGQALAWLTLLWGHAVDHQFTRRSMSAQGQPEGWDDWERASFAGGLAALGASREGRQHLELDPHWHVPFHLEQDALGLQHQLIRFLDSGVVPIRDARRRLQLEIERHNRVRNLIFHLEERHRAGQRTEALLQEVRDQGRPFALFLRGFNNRIKRFGEGAVVSGTGNLEWFALTDLVASITPMPVVWMLNPVDSPAFDQLVAKKQPHEMGFRIEAGSEWEQHVRALIASASFIVMQNQSMTPGVVAEIGMLHDLGRFGETFFRDADAANQATGRSDCRPLDERALEVIARHTTPRVPTAAMPPAMCSWVGGARRTAMEREARASDALRERLDAAQQPVLADLELDVCAWSLSHAVLLNRREAIPSLLARQAALFESLAFDEGTALAADCLHLSAQLRGAYPR